MAGIDKTYCNTIAEHEEFKEWVTENKFITPFGEVIDIADYMYNFDTPIDELQEQVDNGYEITVMNTPAYIDYYLIKHCPIKFVQDRMKQVYPKHYENIINGISPFDNFNRDPIAGTKVKCIKESDFCKKDFLDKRKGKKYISDNWIEVYHNTYWLIYNEEYNYWPIYDYELMSGNSNVCHKPIKSRKALIRQIKKWRLPKGCIVTWRGIYQGDNMMFKVY